ncbi:MAG: PrsW family glutamic-type intramembrane protease [Bacteroidota bacterium]
MQTIELLALALAPIIFIFTFVYLRDKYDREPLKYLIVTFILGVFTAAPVIYIGEWLREITGTSAEAGNLWDLVIYAFLVVATTEEGMKYLVLRWYNYPHREFDEPYDGIMYGVAVSLGFAAIENVLYVFGADGTGVQTGIVRMFTAVPAHAAFGVMCGYFVGKAKFLHGEGNPFLERMKGLAVAILFHGLYDFFLFIGDEFLGLFAFVSLLVALVLARKAMKDHVAISPHRYGKSQPPSDSDPS